MQFCFLRIALLASAIAVNASADTAETDVALTTSHTTSSFVRDDIAASAVTHGPTRVDDEDRAGLTLKEFGEIVGRGGSKYLTGLTKFLDPVIEDGLTPKAVYNVLGLSNSEGNVLLDDKWICWAYLVCQVGHPFDENEYKFIVKAMSAIHGAEIFSKILIAAAKVEKTRHLAINLAKVSNDHIKHFFLGKIPVLTSELLYREQLTAKMVYTTSRGRVFAYLETYVKHNKLRKREFYILTSYLGILLDKNNAVGTALSISHMFSEDAALLNKLLSLSNFHDQEGIRSLVSIWLGARTPPSKIVSMLVHDKAKADHFSVLFSNKLTKSFWLRYLKKYNRSSENVGDLMRTAKNDFEQLLMMLHAVEVPESSTADKNLASSTILKILLSPEITNVITDQKYLDQLTSNWLMHRLSPSTVVYMLVLEEKETDFYKILFTNTPSSKYWETYTNAYYADTPTLQNYKMTTLLDVFDGASLKRILEAACAVDATNKKTASLLTQLNMVDAWLS